MIEHRWPHYEVAPEESVYALGVASINYARFERTHVWMLCAIANMPEEQAVVFSSRTNPPDRIRIMEVFLKRREWPEEALAAIKHYLKAMEILILNRNILIHSNMIRGPNDQAAIYSTSRQGSTSMFQSTLADIRQVADDLNTYFYFGIELANYIATEIHHMARAAGSLVVKECPALPDMPVHIDPEQRKK
jgi:hypothetical protein